MKKIAKARISWISKEDGGRTYPPEPGTRYCPIVVFDTMNLYKDGFWSADFICNEVDEKMNSIVDFAFFSEDAPIELLVDGNRFELFEGNRKVAFGIILK